MITLRRSWAPAKELISNAHATARQTLPNFIDNLSP